MARKKKGSHCGICGKKGSTSRTHCRICGTHCSHPNNSSLCTFSESKSQIRKDQKEIKLPSNSFELEPSLWLKEIEAMNKFQTVELLHNGENMFNCLVLLLKSIGLKDAPKTAKEMRIIISNELRHPSVEGFSYEYQENKANNATHDSKCVANSSKSLKEFYNKIKKPFRTGGEFGNNICLLAMSNRFQLKILVFNELEKTLKTLGSQHKETIYLVCNSNEMCYKALIDDSFNLDSLDHEWIQKKTKHIISDVTEYAKASGVLESSLSLNNSSESSMDTNFLALTTSKTENECRQRLANINNWWIFDPPGRGDCLFHAILANCRVKNWESMPQSILEMKNAISLELESNKTEYSLFFIPYDLPGCSQTYDEFATNMRRLAPDGGEWGNENCLKPIASLFQISVVIYKNKFRQPLIFGEDYEKECLLYLDPEIPHYFVFFEKSKFNEDQICKRYPGVITNSDYSKYQISSSISSVLVEKTNLTSKKNLNATKSQSKIDFFLKIHNKGKHDISQTTNEQEINIYSTNKKMKLINENNLEIVNSSSDSCNSLKHDSLAQDIDCSEKTTTKDFDSQIAIGNLSNTLVLDTDKSFSVSKQKNNPPSLCREKALLCDSCKRCSLEGFDIDLTTCEIDVHGKKYGAMNKYWLIYSNPTLCYYCKKMFTSNQKSLNFQTCWAAWIDSMLEDGAKKNIKHNDYAYLPKYLSDVLLKMWMYHPHVKQGVHFFADKTLELKEFNDNIYETPGSFRKMSNEYCWPDVRCPLGCWQHADECRMLEYHHFISGYLNFKIPSSNKKFTVSFRRDWPLISMNCFKWCIKPSLVMYKSKGLCILLCKYHDNSSL